MKNNENKKVAPAALDDDVLEGVVGGAVFVSEESGETMLDLRHRYYDFMNSRGLMDQNALMGCIDSMKLLQKYESSTDLEKDLTKLRDLLAEMIDWQSDAIASTEFHTEALMNRDYENILMELSERKYRVEGLEWEIKSLENLLSDLEGENASTYLDIIDKLRSEPAEAEILGAGSNSESAEKEVEVSLRMKSLKGS